MPSAARAAVYDGDFFADDVLANTIPTYKLLRDLGDAVWLSKLDMYAVARYDDVLACLKASDTLISGQGVSVNASMNGPSSPANASTLTTDGMVHHQFKRVEMRPLGSGSIVELRARLEREANIAVDLVSHGGEFDAMATLAPHLPLRVVADLVGIKDVNADKMLQWSGAIFDAFGPADHARTVGALPTIVDFVGFGARLQRSDLLAGGWADRMLEAADAGEIAQDAARSLIFDYVLPSLDTTIYATGELLYQLAKSPDAFNRLRQQPELVPSAIYEAVRLASPLRGFTRLATEDFPLDQTTIPAGVRVFVLHAAANRDERHYPNPDDFDVTRNPRDHVGWGHGVHSCSGMHLARAEMEVLLQTLLDRVEALELAGEPTRIVNNAAQGYAKLPLRLRMKA